MVEDHLDKETSVSAELIPTGVKASAKSRFVAAIDRLGGNLVELMNTPIEAKNSEKRAISEGRVRAIEAVTQMGIERLKTDSEFADRALRSHLGTVFARQENKDKVMEKAVEDLRRQPPSEDEASSGPEVLDETFQSRFERYAEEATTEALREKWGRVLASEIRTPGTFSGKVLRVVDELDASTAELFERVCQYRMEDVIPKSLLGEISYMEAARLANAGLIFEPGMGQVRPCAEMTDNVGVKLWFWPFGNIGVAATQAKSFPAQGPIFNSKDGKPALPVFALTDIGSAISSILPSDVGSMINQLAGKISEALPDSEVRRYVHAEPLRKWIRIDAIPPQQPADAGQP